jgi:hypothetical protein
MLYSYTVLRIYIFPANKIDTGYYNPERVNRLILYGSLCGGKELIPRLQHLLIILNV